MEAGFGLEPLAGEAQVDCVARCCVDAAEGQVCGLPDFGACGVGREQGPSDVVGSDEVDLPGLDHGDGGHVHPDVFPQQGACPGCRIVFIFRDALTVQIMAECSVRPSCVSLRMTC